MQRHRLISSAQSLFAPFLHVSPVETIDTSASGMNERILQLLEAALSSMHSTRADPHCQLRTQSRMSLRVPLKLFVLLQHPFSNFDNCLAI